jgi:hypothetical protein
LFLDRKILLFSFMTWVFIVVKLYADEGLL